MRSIHRAIRAIPALVAAVALLFVLPAVAAAHCDTMDGPVVLTGQAALQSGDLTPALKWVHPEGEAEVREAFEKARAVRASGGAAKELADRWFLETYVRVHRAGEGAGFDGLKPAGAVEPAIALADRSLETDTGDRLAQAVAAHVTEGILERHRRVMEAKRHSADSVEAGRAYVAAYVDFIHYVERVHAIAVAEPAAEHDHADAGVAAPAGAGGSCGHVK